MVLGGGFELYEGLWWGNFQFFKDVSLIGGQFGVSENTISFIQKLTEMRPLHDPPDPRPPRPGLHLACQPAIDSASIILRKADGPGPVR